MTLIRQCDYCHKAIEPSENISERPISLWSSKNDGNNSETLWDFHPKCFDNIKVWLGLTFEDKKCRG